MHRSCMPVTTLRLSFSEKRRFTAEARRRGLSLSEFLRQSAHASGRWVDWKTFFAAIPAVTLPRGATCNLSFREGFSV